MAAATEERDTVERAGNGIRYDIPAATAVQFYRGAMVSVDATTGLAINAVAGTPADRVVGKCTETKLTVAGDTIGIKDGVFRYTQDGSITQVMAGGNSLCYVVDDQTVTEDSATGTPPVAGSVMERVSATEVDVRFQFVLPAAVATDPTP